MMITKIRRDTKALSPIFAALILIAIAVIAGIVVYMFTSGTIATMTGGGTAGQEKVAVQAVEADAATDSVTVWAKSTGGTDVVIDGVILKDSGGATVDVQTIGGTTLLATGALNSVAANFAAGSLSAGDTYTVTLTSVGGGSFVSSSFKP